MPILKRKPSSWQLRSKSLQLGEHTLVMGILNVTPDSFSDGGAFRDLPHAVEAALKMLEDGAGILDIGGESTRPGKRELVSAGQEIDRVLPVIEEVIRQQPDAVISIDTYKAETARAAIASGAEIVNDVSGFLWDDRIAATCSELQCGVVLMHSRGRPEEWSRLPRLSAEEAVPLVTTELRQRLEYAVGAGISPARIALDPGIGFGKAYESNYPLLSHLGELRALGQPLLVGVSRKSFLGRTLAALRGGIDAPAGERSNATLAAVTATILAGADIVRVHEVRPAVEAAAIADAVLAAAD